MRGSEWTIRSTTAYRVVPDVPTDPPEAEPHICGTCYWFEPCPCNRCGWGYCNSGSRYDGYVPEDSICGDWKEA